jgi:hypothetical protein
VLKKVSLSGILADLTFISIPMPSLHSVAAKLPSDARKQIAIQSLARRATISRLAIQEKVSRKFIYQQKHKADAALNQAFSPAEDASDVLFYLPVTAAWLNQLVLSLVLICHSSYRGVIQLLAALFDTSISLGTIHNLLVVTSNQATQINGSQDFSAIQVGLLDEIFQGNQPVLAGVDATSTYCYLLSEAEQRDETTWGVHLLDAKAQGLNPTYTIADAATGLRAGHRAALGDIPCHGDVFHIQHQCETLANLLERLAKGSTTRRKQLEQRMAKAKLKGQGNSLSSKLVKARNAEACALKLAKDVKTLVVWLERDILALAGPCFEDRRELFDFIVNELKSREHLDPARIRPVRVALERQRDKLLGFAKMLDTKLAGIAQQFQVSDYLVRAICLLQRKAKTSQAYWQRRDYLNQQLASKFYVVLEAVVNAMDDTHRSSSLVENLNGRLRNYFFLRRNLGQGYLDLLRFFLNHRVFMRSERPERVGKSPTELMTGKPHPHWLELLGFELFRRPPILA